MLMATINASIMLIALPDIFRGIGLNPLQPGNTGLLLWLIMGYLVVTAVLVVSFGRLGDMFGRVRMFNLGFALGLNQVAGIAGSFIGLVLGGVLGPIGWRYVFLVSVPFGVLGTIWSYLKLQDMTSAGPRRRHERHLPELRDGAVHRDLLHPDHPRPGLLAAGRAEPRPGRPGGAALRRRQGRRAAAGLDHVRRELHGPQSNSAQEAAAEAEITDMTSAVAAAAGE
jgi:MFS family permease